MVEVSPKKLFSTQDGQQFIRSANRKCKLFVKIESYSSKEILEKRIEQLKQDEPGLKFPLFWDCTELGGNHYLL